MCSTPILSLQNYARISKIQNSLLNPILRLNLSKNTTVLSVPGTGVEPAQPYGHYHLKVACIPFHHPGKFVHFNRNYIIFKKGEKEG